LLFGKTSLVAGSIWAVVDPIVIALPISAIVTVVASLATAPANAAAASSSPEPAA
jgi:SSS family solute:Na+ symporter